MKIVLFLGSMAMLCMVGYVTFKHKGESMKLALQVLADLQAVKLKLQEAWHTPRDKPIENVLAGDLENIEKKILTMEKNREVEEHPASILDGSKASLTTKTAVNLMANRLAEDLIEQYLRGEIPESLPQLRRKTSLFDLPNLKSGGMVHKATCPPPNGRRPIDKQPMPRPGRPSKPTNPMRPSLPPMPVRNKVQPVQVGTDTLATLKMVPASAVETSSATKDEKEGGAKVTQARFVGQRVAQIPSQNQEDSSFEKILATFQKNSTMPSFKELAKLTHAFLEPKPTSKALRPLQINYKPSPAPLKKEETEEQTESADSFGPTEEALEADTTTASAAKTPKATKTTTTPNASHEASKQDKSANK
ncbi:hypothetical protein NEHOM01_1533 [Nematocida homosporus]|uniref:uncharacterized protein n=1 Tax=Nematocida homosporus TaxID=1912981 RepID=UPI00221E5218|nr:uncharacterized protein NEHOM01_1533 [Nematocida homosporus]KAI5186533.1 hypothetical protein NEHOM01_1533 [Nematocida homosporus]